MTMTVADFLIVLGIFAPMIGTVMAYLIARDKASDKRSDKLHEASLEECREQREISGRKCDDTIKELRGEIKVLHSEYHDTTQRILSRVASAMDTLAENSGTNRPAVKKSDRLPKQERT